MSSEADRWGGRTQFAGQEFLFNSCVTLGKTRTMSPHFLPFQNGFFSLKFLGPNLAMFTEGEQSCGTEQRKSLGSRLTSDPSAPSVSYADGQCWSRGHRETRS